MHRIPSILVATDGTVLGFADRRVGSRADWGHRTDVVVRRSTDGGESWFPAQTLFGEDGVCAHGGPALVDRRTGRVFKFFRKFPAEFRNRADVVAATAKPQQREKWLDWGAGSYVVRSDDHGRTWTRPERLVIEHPRIQDIPVVGNGIHGVQLEDGTLVVQGGGGMQKEFVRGEPDSQLSFLLLSTDGGATWERGAEWVVDGACREYVLTRLGGGRIYVNQRAPDCRLVAWLEGPRDASVRLQPDRKLVDPYCHAGGIMLEQMIDGRSVMLFSNPPVKSPKPGRYYPEGRRELTVRMSLDEGKSWPVAKRLEPGLSGYSDLAAGPDGTIYCIYETGEEFYAEDIAVARFQLDRLRI